MLPLRLQFTIRGLLWATFWVAVSAACFCYAKYHEGPASPFAVILLSSLFFMSPCLAVGFLCGRPFAGFIAGLAAIALAVVMMSLTAS